ncbi:MAG: PAS domain-containing protein [Candidatus Tectomicrobia bacterium]|uniref:histidine kinase n=1 Tax=Tectimicrobiota bacterium TaxID=2528274 RepID=A0A932GPV6_UNCTE|nr:PAS domain-containing protein [Candidatus Tectomicrobia bacterium]
MGKNPPEIREKGAEKDEENYLESVLASLSDGVLTVNESLHITTVNQAMEELSHLPAAKMLGEPFGVAFPDQRKVEDLLLQAAREGKTFFLTDHPLKTPQGRLLLTGVTISPLTNREGETLGAVMDVRDMSRLKGLEESERISDHLDVVATMTAGMAHEIKNPLGGIKGAAQLLLEELNSTDLKEYPRIIIREVERVNAILEVLLGLSAPRAPRQEPVNIHRILESILLLERQTPQGKKISFQVQYDPSLPEVIGDEEQMTQLILNLVRNGVEAMTEGGTLILSTRTAADLPLARRDRTGQAQRMILVEISDTGGGIPPELMDKIFTPYFTTKPRGTGLGLALANQIVRAHRGKLEVQSFSRKGTTVRVYLPASSRGK